MHEPATDRVDRPARQLRLRSVAALALIALAVIASQAVIQRSIARQQNDAHVVNVAGRQRMLSQKLLKVCLYLGKAQSEPEKTRLRADLEETLGLWQRSHSGLQHGDPAYGLPGKNSPAVTALFQEIDPHFQAMVAAAGQILAAPQNATVFNQSLATLGEHEPLFLNGMDAIVVRYDREAEHKVAATRQIELALASLTLLLLALEGWLIFFPAIRRLSLLLRRQQSHQADIETLFASNPSALFLIDKQSLEIVRCNRQAETMIGCSVNEILQQRLGAFLDAMHENNKHFLESIGSGQESPEESEVVLLDAKHTIVEALASSRLLVFDDRPALLVAMTNITEIKKAQEALHYHATFDEMTSLVNRRTGLLLLEKEMARSQRDAMPLAVCFVDLDGLKGVNDGYGHEEGDWLIVKAAEILAESIRLGDEAIRLGGDEFLLVLHNCSEEGSRILLQRIEERMAQVTAEAHKPFPLAASMGLAIYDPARHMQVHQLIAEADRRMYLKKQLKKAPTVGFA
jgi:diguanylate cyclase (GGDEF)-like protein/PAS domain S-box-containing protein